VPVSRFPGDTPQERWEAKLEFVEAEAGRLGCGHVLFDTLARVAAVDEENGTDLGKAADAVSAMAQRSRLAVTIVHHAPKGATTPEAMFRGHTSLTAAVEQIVAVWKQGKAKRERRLWSFGRHDTEIWEREIELSKDRSTYTGKLVDSDDSEADEDGTMQDELRDAIVKFVNDQDGVVSTKEVAEGVETSSRTELFKKALKAAWTLGRIEEVKKGKWAASAHE
jgi:hypothetical protein